mmetsp:Transcript_7957/g.21245  ORF Transcript_7957/g.21245 Transcript_7957/m.21245 type:complete len:231 (+) Transcript_7957:49-741(+)
MGRRRRGPTRPTRKDSRRHRYLHYGAGRGVGRHRDLDGAAVRQRQNKKSTRRGVGRDLHRDGSRLRCDRHHGPLGGDRGRGGSGAHSSAAHGFGLRELGNVGLRLPVERVVHERRSAVDLVDGDAYERRVGRDEERVDRLPEEEGAHRAAEHAAAPGDPAADHPGAGPQGDDDDEEQGERGPQEQDHHSDEHPYVRAPRVLVLLPPHVLVPEDVLAVLDAHPPPREDAHT